MRRASLIALLLLGCDDDPSPARTGPLEVGESRRAVLRFTPLDVTNFEKSLTRIELRQLPPALLQRTWLTDLELRTPGDGAPRMVDHAIAQMQARDSDDPDLSVGEANLIRLLRMTPATADLSGTRLAPLLDMAPHLGFAVAEVLGEALGVRPGEPFLSSADLGAAMARHLVGTHPNARTRRGPVTADHPDGRYDVTPGALPVFLDDLLSDLRTLERRYGPFAEDGLYHPGFVGPGTRAALFGDDLSMVVKATLNGVPDKGLDLETASEAGVNSIDDHPEALFDFSDPDWMGIEGTFADPPVVERLVFHMVEDPRYLAAGTGPEPAPFGDSPVWNAPPHVLERVVAEAAYARWGDATWERTWSRRDTGEPLLRITLDRGWMTVETPGRVGDPPPPAYVWDLLLEVAQVRLHDGGVNEGAIDLDVVIEQVPLGLSMDALVDRVKASLQAEPQGLVDLAVELFDNTWGEADFFYRRVGDDDYLFYLAPEDIPGANRGAAVRPYAYETPGFFADEALTEPRGGRAPVDGDVTHLKVRIEPGDALFVSDEGKRAYRLDVLDKPGRSRVALTVTRVR